MATRSLPPRPSLDQLKLQASELQRAYRDGEASAAARVIAHHPEMRRPFALADAQLVIAREYGFRNWAELKHRVELAARIDRITPHPRFDETLAALDAGDVQRLRDLLAADPSLVRARTNLEPPYGYFSAATLLHHVAGNPWRDNPLPPNIIEIARLLLDAGADVNARTLGPNGGDTMGLLVTSKQANDAGVTGPMMDLLLERGAQLDLNREDVLDASLRNHAPRAAEKMIELGAKPDVLAAAALGRMDLLRRFFTNDGRLQARPHRGGKELSERDAIGLALLYAYVRDQREAVDFLLEKDGNWNMTGVNNGAVLHRAAFAGDLDMVQRLVAKGADVSNRDNPFNSTPLSWADHNKQSEVFEWIQTHCAIDLHDAVTFGLRDHVEARLREDPASVNARRDHWDMPLSTPLHCAAATGREDLARLLLQRGADSTIMAGNGMTALDVADYQGSAGVAALLEEHGGSRTAEAARASAHPKLKPFEKIAKDVFDAYRADDAEALQRVCDFFKRTVTRLELRRGVQRRLRKDKDADISLAEARDVVAGLRGFASWAQLAESVTRPDSRGGSWAVPLYRIDDKDNIIHVRHSLDNNDWDTIIAVIKERRIAGLDANGQMVDEVMERIAALEHVAKLNLGGSNGLTDAGLRHLARMPQLRELDLSGWEMQITDRGLEALRHLTELRRFEMSWPQRVSDAGVTNLRFCDRLEHLNVMGTPTGDGTIDALAGKVVLRHVKTGKSVTNAGLALFHRFPAFTSWHGGTFNCSLMSFDAGSNHLMVDGPFTNRGVRSLADLEGVVGLSFFRHVLHFTADGLKALAALPNLLFLGFGGELCTDEAMRNIASFPRLRMLEAQGTLAGDDGFVALSRSQTIEYIWGRECPNLTGRGFAALSNMPALRGLAVSCKNVDEASLSTLPRFPALRELMPMDVSDEGFRHVGRCHDLERLWCMYCRDTTDTATEHIAELKLKTYYAGQTKITDRSLEILGRMSSLEKLEFWNIAGITSAGVAHLAALPRLREVSFDGCRHIGAEAGAAFGPDVRVTISA